MNAFTVKNIILSTVFTIVFSTFLKAQQGETTVNQDKRIAQLLETQSQMIKEDKLSDRYKIQLYSGDVTTASRTLKKYRTSLGTWTASIKHETPNYKVWVGNFRNKLEAERALEIIAENFSGAFIFKPTK